MSYLSYFLNVNDSKKWNEPLVLLKWGEGGGYLLEKATGVSQDNSSMFLRCSNRIH